MKRESKVPVLIVLLIVLAGCLVTKEKSLYEKLTDYEGTYEYHNRSTLTFAASNFDTTLYAIVDNAKYPLIFISQDTFENREKKPVIFQRDKQGKLTSYQAEGGTFKLLTTDIDPQEWFPRKEWWGKAAGYSYHIPVKLDDGLEVGDVRAAFANSEALLEMVRETIQGHYPDVHSILVFKDNKLVLEEYFYGYNQDTPHQLRSASKSFIGTLVGIAIDQGKIKSEQERLLPFFAKQYGYFAHMDQRKERITIKDFLTYRHGMDCNDENPATAGHELKMMESPDWVKFTLDLPMVEEAGVRSSYCTGCAQTLGHLVEIATNTPLVEYADHYLFSPMKITKYQWRFQPDTSSKLTFNQMYLRPRDMLKLAKMYQDKGKWEGRQIVSQEWVEKTFAKDDVEFGYLWRHKYVDVKGKTYHSYLATGNGGQKINIWPELNMITVFTGGNYNSFLYGRTTPPNEMIPKYILNALY